MEYGIGAPPRCGCNFGDARVLTGQCSYGNVGAFLLMAMIEESILKQCVKRDPCRPVLSVEDGYPSGVVDKEYDFIVVGGGVAGKN